MKRFLWLSVIVILFLICTGCGDTFRPVIIPNPPKFPDPRAAHSVVAISDNNTNGAQSDRGTVMAVDVSGDSVVGVADVGLAPVHAVQQTANQVLVVNHSVTGALGDSLTKVVFFGTQISNTSTITLPPDSAPNFVASTESGTAYVTLPGFTPPSLAVVNTSTSTVATLPVGNNPVAVAETPDGSKVYVANQASNSISAFNTKDRSARPIDTTGFPNAFNGPHWIVVRSDNQRVYVLDGDGSLVTIDPTSNSGITDKVIAASPNVGAKSAYLLYDGHLNRLYVPSGVGSGTPQLAVVDVSSSQPPAPIVVPIATVPPSARGAQDPCATTATAPLNVVSVAALPDGSRVYVGSYYIDSASNICPQVTAINTSSNTIKTATAVPGFTSLFPSSPPVCATTLFRFTMAAGGDSSRVYLASCDAGNVNVVDTSTDTYLLNLKAPGSSRPPINDNQPPPQNPVWLIAGP